MTVRRPIPTQCDQDPINRYKSSTAPRAAFEHREAPLCTSERLLRFGKTVAFRSI